MRCYRLGAHTKTDLKVHLAWILKYRKRVLVGQVAVRVRDVLRQIAFEHELEIIPEIIFDITFPDFPRNSKLLVDATTPLTSIGFPTLVAYAVFRMSNR